MIVCAACGRVGFDARNDAAPGDGVAADVAIDAPPPHVSPQRHYIKASNPNANDLFGQWFSLSSDGSTLAVGAANEASGATGIDGNQLDNSASTAGAVYVFVRSGNTWVQQAYVKASNTNPGDNFGIATALSADGSTLAVGAYVEDSDAMGIDGNQGDNTATDSGAVYIYVRVGQTWSQQEYIKASNTGAGDLFGTFIALSADGSTLAVGAPGEDSAATGIDGNQADNSATGAGAAYVFTRAGTAWSQQAYVKASNTDAGDQFGSYLALSADGSTLAVSAFGESSAATGVGGNQGDNSSAGAGAVYVFTRAGTTWSQQAYIKASNTGPSDMFGDGVALSGDGNTLAAGAPLEDSAASGIDGNQADNSLSSSGAVYVFTRAGTAWSQQAYVKASNPDGFDTFGYNLALDGDGSLLVVGAEGEDSAAIGLAGNQADNSASGAGAAYAFGRVGGVWTQLAYVKASNTNAGDIFGDSVGVSADGSTIVVSARDEASSASGVDGNQADNSAAAAGAVYIFE